MQLPTTPNYAALRAIRPEDVPAEYQDILDLLGMDAFLNLIWLCGGQSVYLPTLDTLKKDGRDRELRARYNGYNSRALAREFRLSHRQVRKIINGARR